MDNFELKLRIALLIGVFVYTSFIFFLLKKGKLSVRYSIIWFASAAALLVFALFPYIVLVLGDIFRVINPVNFVFTVVIAFGLFVSLSLSSAVSSLDLSNKRLAQKAALLEARVRELESAQSGEAAAQPNAAPPTTDGGND